MSQSHSWRSTSAPVRAVRVQYRRVMSIASASHGALHSTRVRPALSSIEAATSTATSTSSSTRPTPSSPVTTAKVSPSADTGSYHGNSTGGAPVSRPSAPAITDSSSPASTSDRAIGPICVRPS